MFLYINEKNFLVYKTISSFIHKNKKQTKNRRIIFVSTTATLFADHTKVLTLFFCLFVVFFYYLFYFLYELNQTNMALSTFEESKLHWGRTLFSAIIFFFYLFQIYPFAPCTPPPPHPSPHNPLQKKKKKKKKKTNKKNIDLDYTTPI